MAMPINTLNSSSKIYFLYSAVYIICIFECAYECGFIEGGKWRQEKCNETSQEDEKHLNKWLTDTTGAGRMISRGFQEGELSSTTGTNVFPPRTSDSLLYFKEGGHMQYALYYILFLPEKWNNGMTAHALLFLKAFCWVMSVQFFNGQYTETDGGSFKNECQDVRGDIERLIDSKTIVPVATENKTVKYTDLMEIRHFWKYIEWLKDNLEHLITSLTEMSNDVQNWKDKESLKTSSTFGPYPWGFTFRNNWEQKKDDFKSKLEELTETLTSFSTALDEIKHIPSSSTASTVGGVAAGLGAAGAAGAAAYSGLLGSAAEGIGKFFKGLVL